MPWNSIGVEVTNIVTLRLQIVNPISTLYHLFYCMPCPSLGFVTPTTTTTMEQDGVVSKPVALISCASMALLYVAILYTPTVVLRLPPPPSFKTYMIRRFLCAIVSSILSLSLSALILPVCTLPSHFVL